MTHRIAIIEDQPDLARNYSAALEREGYEVDLYTDRISAQNAFEARLPDLVIIDIELGDDTEGGHHLCSYLRTRSETLPIIMFTARDNDLDEMLGFKMGANEYVTKGKTIDQLVRRVEALLRLASAIRELGGNDGRLLECGSLCLDLDAQTARWKGQPFRLTYSAFRMVECLARRPGQIKSREQLMEAADKYIAPESVNTYIKRIRQAIRDVDPDADPIRSEHSLGYRWVRDEA